MQYEELWICIDGVANSGLTLLVSKVFSDATLTVQLESRHGLYAENMVWGISTTFWMMTS